MAFTGYSTFLSSLEEQNIINANITGGSGSNTRLNDLYALALNPVTGLAVAAPSTAVALSKSDTTALNYYLPNYSPESPYIIGARLAIQQTLGTYFIIDRLSHQSGLSGSITTAQTTNLPTAALTRYTNGVGVMIGLTIYTTIGGTAATVTASYTNQAGVSGKTTTVQSIGGSGNNTAPRMIFLPLQAGDIGVRSVESVTLTANTGLGGNIGVTLFKILGAVCVDNAQAVSWNDIITGGFIGGIPEISDSTHISLLGIFNNTTSTGGISMFIGEA
jgi:hypothetical protein